MRILIATPLYPPDIALPAPYAKELAARLTRDHTVSVLTYAHLPEPVPGVSITSVNKRQPLWKRLLDFTAALIQLSKKADVVFVENGSSTELPAFIASFFTNVPIVVHSGDPLAQKQVRRNPLRRFLTTLTRLKARALVTDVPNVRPEILPFEPKPADAFARYESSWHTHLAVLTKTLQTL